MVMKKKITYDSNKTIYDDGCYERSTISFALRFKKDIQTIQFLLSLEYYGTVVM